MLLMLAAMAGAAAMPAQAAQAQAAPATERELDRACQRGDRAACITLGQQLADPGSPAQDHARALTLLRPICDAPASVREAGEVCGIVAELLLVEQTIGASGADAALTGAYLTRACDMGSRPTCALLAGELASGERLPADPARATDLAVRLCRAGEPEWCPTIAAPEPRSQIQPEHATDRTTALSYDDLPAPRPEPDGDPAEDDAQQPSESSEALHGGAGRRQEPMLRVHNGNTAPRGSANWVAMLWRPDRIAREYRLLCGGSLIAPGWVLTAAHCLDDSIGAVTERSGHTIRLGVHDPQDEKQGTTHVITGVFKHPSFRGIEQSKTLAWDIALVRFSPKPRTRGTIRGTITPVPLDTIPLPQREIRTDTRATVLGWGRNRVHVQRTTRALLQGQVYLQDRLSCTKDTAFTDIRRDSVLCAQERRGQHNCSGDSGGPMVVNGEQGRGRVLIGVISSANACGTGDKPSRFIRVTHPAVRAWLAQILPPDVWRRINAPQ
jgi:V8-like Glu-specific endopeptidase